MIKRRAEDGAAVCDKCTGENKYKPNKGILIIWDMKKDGEKWIGGKIMEADSGTVYSCKSEALDGRRS